MERCHSQQVIRNQPSAETVYEKRGRTVNTDLQTVTLFQLWHILITLLINSTVGVYYSVSRRGRTEVFVCFCIIFFLLCGNYKDKTGWKLVTFPGNASLWPSGWFYSGVADATSSLNDYNTAPVIFCNNKMHKNHAVLCRLNAKPLCDVTWHCCKPLNMNSIYESCHCLWHLSWWGTGRHSVVALEILVCIFFFLRWPFCQSVNTVRFRKVAPPYESSCGPRRIHFEWFLILLSLSGNIRGSNFSGLESSFYRILKCSL